MLPCLELSIYKTFSCNLYLNLDIVEIEEPDGTLHKKWNFPFRISSVNVTNSTVTCGIGHFPEEILYGKLHFLCNGICSLTFAVDELSGLFLHPSIFSIIHWRSA